MTPSHKVPATQNGRLTWADATKVGVPIILTIIGTAIGLYIKVEVSTAVTSSRLQAVEDAIKRLPSSEQLEAFRTIANSRLDMIEERLRRAEGRRDPR